MQTQSTKSKIAEVKYRSQITKQHLGEKEFFPNEPREKEFVQILKSRLDTYQKTFKNLNYKKLIKSPFLEIGAEYCLASTLLVSKFGAWGIATDISLASLKNAPQFAKKFKFKKLPKIICADATNLPFKESSFPFVFVYESLHHFQDPQPVINELNRVLTPQGTLLIGSEPIKQSFQLKLWRRPNKLRLWEKLLKATLLLPFISHIGKTEVEHGILEEAFGLKKWLNAFSIFDSFEAKITIPFVNISQKITKAAPDTSFIFSLILKITGGGIMAICQKEKTGTNTLPAKIEFICPSCKLNLHKETILVKSANSYSCQKCYQKFQKRSGILILLEKKLEKEILRAIDS